MRMGVGYGSFIPLGFAFEEDPRLKLFSSQFYGTGVIRAVEAEKHLERATNRCLKRAGAANEGCGSELA